MLSFNVLVSTKNSPSVSSLCTFSTLPREREGEVHFQSMHFLCEQLSKEDYGRIYIYKRSNKNSHEAVGFASLDLKGVEQNICCYWGKN